MSRPVSVGSAVAAAADRLAASGIAGARREALQLWSALGDEPPAWLEPDATLPPARLERFRLAVERRAAGRPFAYVTGTAGFRRLVLWCDPRALIPRPETEGLVERVLALAPRGRALDLGTGSGCIALALADEGAYDLVCGVEACPAALALARANGARTGLPVRWIAGDWCAGLAGGGGRGRFDVVVSNPPYVTSAEWSRLDPSVRDWEPRLALDGGADGLGAIARILRQAPRVLASGGLLALEVDSARAPAAARLAGEAGWAGVTLTQDLFGRDRFLTARWESPHA